LRGCGDAGMRDAGMRRRGDASAWGTRVPGAGVWGAEGAEMRERGRLGVLPRSDAAAWS
jgi:hypothetical protein